MKCEQWFWHELVCTKPNGHQNDLISCILHQNDPLGWTVSNRIGRLAVCPTAAAFLRMRHLCWNFGLDFWPMRYFSSSTPVHCVSVFVLPLQIGLFLTSSQFIPFSPKFCCFHHLSSLKMMSSWPENNLKMAQRSHVRARRPRGRVNFTYSRAPVVFCN